MKKINPKVSKTIKSKLSLPEFQEDELNFLEELTASIGVPREVIASNDQIEEVWEMLPKILNKIPIEYRNPLLARMCVAIKTGLFDSAINYAWNLSVLSLRNKLEDFGLAVASQLLEKDLTDGKLKEIMDTILLEYCLELNLLSEDGYYFLNQCRDIRNSYSAAHPVQSEEIIDQYEVISFFNRCAKYSFDKSSDPRGIDVKNFIGVIKNSKLEGPQKKHWLELILQTNEKQRDFISKTLHGIYCDDSSAEISRINCLELCRKLKSSFTPKILSNFINQHHEYLANGKLKKHDASRIFFEKLGLLDIFSEEERHAIVSRATKNLMDVHQGFNNFYNEPPFAERLFEISLQGAIPDYTKPEFVEVVITCAVGNFYGISNAAFIFYEKIIKNFTPGEIDLMLKIPKMKTIVSERISNYPQCKKRFIDLIKLLNSESIPTSLIKIYKKYLSS